ncbi:alpha/beta fold hydrolase [Neochlamydia sp. EPS4]|uniref:alpha/beta fold hydrolase n=1 Tax=Neochlamydia sp. EPS4 TaxID=1478175 RepID=UPI000694B3DB|nr:alpha/beta fold hydrolase [Neochlamydia sp. EPS4]
MTKIHALHGFLGLPTDWQRFNLPNLHAYSLRRPSLAPAADGLWGWAKRFNRLAQPRHDDILMGYSLGGRLALHALLDNPNQWRAGIIISAHPGLTSKEEKIKRVQADKAWADRFGNDPWQDVIRDWNCQAVFGGKSFPLKRSEHQFLRKNLQDQLKFFSTGHQDDLSEALKGLPLPILWISGQLDTKFLAKAHELTFSHPLSRVESIAHAGHRAPWEQSILFLKIIQSFIQEVLSCP